MKISSIDLRQILDSRNADAKNTDSKKETAAIENKFEKLLNRSISHNSIKSDKNIEKSQDEPEEKLTETSEETPSEKDEQKISHGIVDVSLLMRLLSNEGFLDKSAGENISANDLLPLLENIKLGTGEENIELLSRLLNSEGDISNEILKMLSQDDTSFSAKDLKSLLGLLDESAAGANSKTENLEVLMDKLQVLIDKSNIKEQFTKIVNTADNEVAQNNILLNENSLEPAAATSGQNVDSDNKDTSSGETESKEEKLLKSIINSDNKAENKIYAFSGQLNRLRDDSVSVQNVTEALNVNKNNLVNDVVKVMRYMNTNNLKELTIKITPQELGEMTIKISMEGNLIKASITASNKDTYSLLNSSAAEMKNSLNNTQIKIQDVEINFYNEDTTFFSGGFEKSGHESGEQGRRGSSSRNVNDLDEVEEISIKEITKDESSNISILA